MTIVDSTPLAHPFRLRWIVVLPFLGLYLGCTTTIIPPTHPADPVTVYLLDHGRTPSLVLPVDDGTMIRYAYGDWNWYALSHRGFLDAFPTLFWPTRGALGRKPIPGPADPDHIRTQVAIPIEHMYPLLVDRWAVRELRRRLESLHRQNISTLVVSTESDFYFVHHPSRYCLFHNSNHMAARWLRDLGCRTRGQTLDSRWKLRQPPG